MRFSDWMRTGLLVIVSVVVSVVVSTMPVGAQGPSVSIGGPVLGVVQDGSGGLRHIFGVAGASILGPNFELPAGILRAAVSPSQTYALGAEVDGQQLVFIRLDAGTPAVASVPGVYPKPDLIEWSPGGSAAALYAHDMRVLQVVAGLPNTAQLTLEFDVSVLAGRLSSIAVSDDGNVALLNLTEGESRSLWVVASTGSWQIGAGHPSAMAFLPRRHDAAIADDATSEVFILQNIDQSAVRLPGVVFTEDTRPFSAVAASENGRKIFIARRDSENITILDLDSRIAEPVGCQCKPTGFYPLKGSSVFRLNELSDEALTILHASSTGYQISIIPIAVPTLAPLTESGEVQ